MTTLEMAEIIDKIDKAYPTYWGGRNRTAIAEVWLEHFTTAPYDCIDEAVKEYIRFHKNPPTIADIYEIGATIFKDKQGMVSI